MSQKLISYKKNNYYLPRTPSVKRCAPMQLISQRLSIPNAQFCGCHKFLNGSEVPIYEITSIHALNQLIGYAKFINRSYGDVYYRGECKLHSQMLPSIYRGCTTTQSYTKLKAPIDKMSTDAGMIKELNCADDENYNKVFTIEALLQHYGIKTRYLDIVDNHWIALWMGLYRNIKIKKINIYNHYIKRDIPNYDLISRDVLSDNDFYQYVILCAVPGNCKRINNGIFVSNKFIKVDLRQALPSIFLRPHAQHGLVVRKRLNEEKIDQYDLADSICGIIKIRTDRASKWLGEGNLLTQANLFPAPAYDYGYDLLLSRIDLFNNEFQIAKYI